MSLKPWHIYHNGSSIHKIQLLYSIKITWSIPVPLSLDKNDLIMITCFIYLQLITVFEVWISQYIGNQTYLDDISHRKRPTVEKPAISAPSHNSTHKEPTIFLVVEKQALSQKPTNISPLSHERNPLNRIPYTKNESSPH